MNPSSRLLLAAILALGAHAAFAQTAKTDDTVVPLEKMEVRASRLADSPATVTAIALDTLPAGENSLAGFAAQTPNFFVASNGARSFTDIFAVRGLTNTPIFGTPAVTVYLDGLPLGSGFTFPSELAGFATGELFRGPGQNTVFGRAGPAGVLQFTTPQTAPDGLPWDEPRFRAGGGGGYDPWSSLTAPKTATGEVRASYGNFNTRDVAASVSDGGSYGDVLFVADYSARDGYITETNPALRHDIDYQDALSELARLRWRGLAPNTELTLLFTGLRARDGVQPLVPLGGPLFTVSRSAEGVTDVDAYNTALTAAFNTPVGRLSETTSYTDWHLGPYSNLIKLSPFFSLGNTVVQNQRNWNEELKLTSDAQAAVRWNVGAFFSDGTTSSNVARLAFNVVPTEVSSATIDQRSFAGFGEATFKVGDALALTPGLRVETNRQTYARNQTVPAPPATLNLGATSSALLPKLAASYTLSPQATLFASVGAGYKPGGFSSFTSNAALAPFGPERTTAYEAGVTRETTDHALTATVRAFWYDITGYQIERSFTAADYFVANAPRARSRGAELELTWKPATGLTFTGGFGYTDVTLLKFTEPVAPFTNVDGNRAPYVPLYTANLRADYQDASGWFGGVGATAYGRTNYSEDQNPALSQRAYTLLDAHLGYGQGRWRVSFYGANLTNEGYYSAITPFGSPASAHGTPGAPRTYGVQATVKF
jgi:outer membrane receptor protein involved in Fe transport